MDSVNASALPVLLQCVASFQIIGECLQCVTVIKTMCKMFVTSPLNQVQCKTFSCESGQGFCEKIVENDLYGCPTSSELYY